MPIILLQSIKPACCLRLSSGRPRPSLHITTKRESKLTDLNKDRQHNCGLRGLCLTMGGDTTTTDPWNKEIITLNGKNIGTAYMSNNLIFKLVDLYSGLFSDN